MDFARYRAPIASALASAALLWAAGTLAWWIAWLALAPAAWAALALPGRPGRLAVPLALVLYLETQLIPALPFGIASGQWGDPALPVLIGESPVILVALVAIPLFGLLVYMLPLAPGPGAPTAAAILVPAAALGVLEFARANLDPGGLWGTLSLTQAGSRGADAAGLAGPWLLAFLIAAAGYGIALATARRRPLLLLVPTAVLAVTAASTWAANDGDSGSQIRVAAVQPGYDTAEDIPLLRLWNPGTHDRAALEVIGDLAGPTGRAAAAGAQLVVWPEATAFVDPGQDALVRGLAGRLAEHNGVAIAFPHFDHAESESAVSVISADGELSEPRPKHRPMWFLGERTIEAERGTLEAGGIEIGVLLGVDAQDADNAAALVGDDAELLVTPTHDWEQMAAAQLEQARLLAQATGAGIARADWRHDSAIIAPSGELIAQAPEGKRRALVIGDVPIADPTPYTAIGGLFGWTLVLALGAWSALGLARRKTGPHPERPNRP